MGVSADCACESTVMTDSNWTVMARLRLEW